MATKSRLQRRAATNHLEAMKHDLRYEIWTILTLRTASPKELAKELEANLALVSHHTKRLVQLGCAEMVESRPVRGAIEHFYRATRQILVDADDWNRLLAEDPRLAEHMLGRTMQELLDDYTRSIKAGILGADDQFLLDRTPIVVDAQGCEELIELFDHIEVHDVTEIVQRSTERRNKSDEEPVHMSIGLSIIKTPPPR